ncbi:MAG: hypothetical protein H7Y04_09645, partial [Verrucomicrobia bacterium]|nr:hypothetical protein [Cytophagales bacterium]
MRFIFLFMTVLYLLAACKPRQTARKPDTETQTTETATGIESAFYIKSKVLDSLEYVRVFVQVELKRGYETMTTEKFINRFTGNYVVAPDFGRKDYLATGSIFFAPNKVFNAAKNIFIIQYDLKKLPAQASGVLILEVSDLQTKQKAGDEQLLRFTTPKLRDIFTLSEAKNSSLPVFSNFIRIGETLQLNSLTGQSKKMS